MSFEYSNKTRVHLEVTGKCNLQCKYCFNAGYSTNKNEISLHRLRDLIRECKEMGIKTFAFSGGEPFLYNNFLKILEEECKDCSVSILTNGTLISNEVIMQLKHMPQVTELLISLDGFKGHDSVRLNSKSKNIQSIIRRIRKKMPSMKIAINTIISEANINDVLDLYELLKKIGVSRWRIDMPFYEGRYKKNFESLKYPTFEHIILVIRDLLIHYFSDSAPFELKILNVYNSKMFNSDITTSMRANLNAHPCDYTNWKTISVKPNGDITFCPSLLIKMANITKMPISSALLVASKHPFLNIKIKDLPCKNCRYLNICEGGCRADALYWNGSLLSNDPVSCSIFPLVEKYIWPILPSNQRKLFERSIIKEKQSPAQFSTLKAPK